MVEARQKLCLALFLALSFGVLVNVMILQPRNLTSAEQANAHANASAVTAPAEPVVAFATPSSVSNDIQRELVRLGYLPNASPRSELLTLHAAIMNFQHDAGLPVTGAADDAVLAQLILQQQRPGRRTAETRTPPRDLPPKSAATRVVAAIQSALARQGYTVSRIDGRLTAETRRAIREFEMDRGLEVTGAISADLMARLHDAKGRG